MTEQPPKPEPVAQCPACGQETLRLVSDTMMCSSSACGYEHLLTRPIPIIKPAGEQA